MPSSAFSSIRIPRPGRGSCLLIGAIIGIMTALPLLLTSGANAQPVDDHAGSFLVVIHGSHVKEPAINPLDSISCQLMYVGNAPGKFTHSGKPTRKVFPQSCRMRWNAGHSITLGVYAGERPSWIEYNRLYMMHELNRDRPTKLCTWGTGAVHAFTYVNGSTFGSDISTRTMVVMTNDDLVITLSITTSAHEASKKVTWRMFNGIYPYTQG